MAETPAGTTTGDWGSPLWGNIDLAVAAERWLWQKATLQVGTVPQSFAFDEVN
ncbi:hypothetical protein [Streptomyces sp. NBC_00203]|uniref:hypothetical protein n=1 Tax=Streptomyces sp. NBC_00203 TaxID=2975680 RepID=UPI0032481274